MKTSDAGTQKQWLRSTHLTRCVNSRNVKKVGNVSTYNINEAFQIEKGPYTEFFFSLKNKTKKTTKQQQKKNRANLFKTS